MEETNAYRFQNPSHLADLQLSIRTLPTQALRKANGDSARISVTPDNMSNVLLSRAPFANDICLIGIKAPQNPNQLAFERFCRRKMANTSSMNSTLYFMPAADLDVFHCTPWCAFTFARPSWRLRSCKRHAVKKLYKPKWVRQNSQR